MAELRWALTCDRVITDGETNSVSYIDAIEEIRVSSTPAPFPPVFLATLWERGKPGEVITLRVRINSPEGQETVGRELHLEAEESRHRVNLNLGGAALVTQTGRYFIILDQKTDGEWKQMARLPLEIGPWPAGGGDSSETLDDPS